MPKALLPKLSIFQAIALAFLAKFSLALLFTLAVQLHRGDAQTVAIRLSSDPLILASIQFIAFGGVLTLGLSLAAPKESVVDGLALRRTGWKELLTALIAGLALAIVLAELDNILREIRPLREHERAHLMRLLDQDSLIQYLGLALAISIVAPITEEALFRGLILRGLARSRGPYLALFISSALFGLGHIDPSADLNWPTFFITGAAGLYLGWITLVAGSITPAILIHAAHNSVALIPADRFPIPGLNVLGDEIIHLPMASVAVAGLSLFIAALFFTRREASTTP